jgi:hypothetical protein
MSKTRRTPTPSKRSSEQRDTLGAHKRREMAERMRRPRNAKEAARLLGD